MLSIFTVICALDQMLIWVLLKGSTLSVILCPCFIALVPFFL